jgi:hypothetical protein
MGGPQTVLTDAKYNTLLRIWTANWNTRGFAPGTCAITITSAQTHQANGPFMFQLVQP